MTEKPAPPSDEELSAALDGEAAADVGARRDADPERARRSAELGQAAAFLRSEPIEALTEPEVDRLVQTALDSPVNLGRPARRSPPPGWLVAAVVVVLVAIGLTLVWTGRDQGDDQPFDAASSSTDATDEALAESAPQEAEGGAQAPTTDSAFAATPLGDLGEFTSGDELRQALAEILLADAVVASTGARAEADAAAVARCAEQLAVILDLPAPPQAQATGTVAGTAVLVYEFPIDSFDDGQPTTLIAAVDPASCGQVVVFER